MNNTLSALRRTPYQTLGVFFALVFSFIVLLIFSISIMLLTRVVGYIETQPQVTIYFLKSTPKSEIYKLREKLIQTQKIKEVKYVSQEEALKIYRELNRDEPLLLEMVSKEALPTSLEVFTLKPEYLSDVAKLAKKEAGVEEVAYQQNIVDNLIKITNSIKTAALTFLAAQFLIVFFVIFTTITFKIVNKKEEIEIMRLLGASRYFIMKPLLKQNLLINFIASLTSSAIFVVGYLSFQGKIHAFLLGIPTLILFEINGMAINIWPPNFLLFCLLAFSTLVIGYVIIWFTTLLAASKYIK